MRTSRRSRDDHLEKYNHLSRNPKSKSHPYNEEEKQVLEDKEDDDETMGEVQNLGSCPSKLG